MYNITIQECPVLRPSVKQFQNFRQFVQNLDQKYKKSYGMVKVHFSQKTTHLALIKESKCIVLIHSFNTYAGRTTQRMGYEAERLSTASLIFKQNTFGKSGIYECLHIPKKSMSFTQFKNKSKELDKITDGLSTNYIEEMFWKNVTFSAPLYGADLVNTLMDESSKSWNLNNLDSVLSDALTNRVKGVNSPYCYVGSWKAFFCWHTEDLDLSGINLIHEGKSKFWYAINYQDRHIIEKQAQKIFPQHFSSCKQFLRHKTTLINPYYLKRKYPQLKISKIEHKQNELMIVFGGSYHCGFNFGFNIAEAINYATVDWLRQIVEVKPCQCVKSSVKASEYEIYSNLSKHPAISKSPQFLKFQEYIFDKAENQQSEEQLEEAKKGVSLQFSKKIKKSNKAPKKVVYRNEEYDIESWGQCDKCKIWRVVHRPLKSSDSFECSKVGKQCNKRQKAKPKKSFTIEV